MAESGKKVEVRFGAFSCSVEGYDNPVEQMREVMLLMQRMIHDTPGLADHGPGFGEDEVARIEHALDRRAERQAGGPGIVVIRGPQAPHGGASAAEGTLSERNGEAEANAEDAVTTAEIPPEAPPHFAPAEFPDDPTDDPFAPPEAETPPGAREEPRDAPGHTTADTARHAAGAPADPFDDPSANPFADPTDDVSDEAADGTAMDDAASDEPAPFEAPAKTGADTDRTAPDGEGIAPAGTFVAPVAEPADDPAAEPGTGTSDGDPLARSPDAVDAEIERPLDDETGETAESLAAAAIFAAPAAAVAEAAFAADLAGAPDADDRAAPKADEPEIAQRSGPGAEDTYPRSSPDAVPDARATAAKNRPDTDSPAAAPADAPAAADAPPHAPRTEDTGAEDAAHLWNAPPAAEPRDAAPGQLGPDGETGGDALAGEAAPAATPGMGGTDPAADDDDDDDPWGADTGPERRPADHAASLGGADAEAPGGSPNMRDPDTAEGQAVATQASAKSAPPGETDAAIPDPARHGTGRWADRSANHAHEAGPADLGMDPDPGHFDNTGQDRQVQDLAQAALAAHGFASDNDHEWRADAAPVTADRPPEVAEAPRPDTSIEEALARPQDSHTSEAPGSRRPRPEAETPAAAAPAAPDPAHGAAHPRADERPAAAFNIFAAPQINVFASPPSGGGAGGAAALNIFAAAPEPARAARLFARPTTARAEPDDEPDATTARLGRERTGDAFPDTHTGARREAGDPPTPTGDPTRDPTPWPAHEPGPADPAPSASSVGATAARNIFATPDTPASTPVHPAVDDGGNEDDDDHDRDDKNDRRPGKDYGSAAGGADRHAPPPDRLHSKWDDGLGDGGAGASWDDGLREPPRPAPASAGGERSRFSALLARLGGRGGQAPPSPPAGSGAGTDATAGSGASPADLARRAGASSVSDLLAVAAAWLTLAEGKPRFTRREVMETFERLPGDHPRTLEARIKGFGQLVRASTLILVDDGVFAMAQAERDRYQAMLDSD